MTKTKTSSVNKITPANRKFFMKWLPFNFCDRFCERCDEFQNDCKIYQDELNFRVKCQIEGKDSNDMKIVFEHMSEIMAQTIKMLREMMKEEGVDINEFDEKRYLREEKRKELRVRNHILYKSAFLFSKKLVDFLEKLPIPLIDEHLFDYFVKEVRNLGFYCHLVAIKASRALSSKIEEEDLSDGFARRDFLVSAALGYYSLKSCERSLKVISELLAEGNAINNRISNILKIAGETGSQFKKQFPSVKNFRNKIIFHGQL